MKVIFLQNIKGIARIGDIKKVADGYARNFLIPQKIAKFASEGTIKEVELFKVKYQESDASRREGAVALAGKLKDVVLEVSGEANEEGHLYGSVRAEDLVQALKRRGVEVEEDAIKLEQPLKILGEHMVELELHPEVKVSLKVNIGRD